MAAPVLLVHDDPDAGEMIARLLATAGYKVDLTDDPDLSIERLPGSGTAVLVADSTTGTDSGLRLLHAVRSHPRGEVRVLRVILLSTGGKRLDRMRAWEAGADAVLTRPFHLRQLLVALEETLERDDRAREAHRARALEIERAQGAQARRRGV